MNIAFVPARCGSKSIKFKNIKKFCGKPLIYWSLLTLQKANLVDEIYVASDCDEILNIVDEFGFKKVNLYKRDKSNAQDNSSSEAVMLEFLQKKNFDDDDMFLLVQVTSPTTTSQDINNAIDKLKAQNKDSLLSVVREKKFFWNDDFNPINYDFKSRPRRQDFNGVLLENGAFYINKVKNILRDKNRLSGEVCFYEMKDYNSIDIDEQIDWEIAETYMKEYVL